MKSIKCADCLTAAVTLLTAFSVSAVETDSTSDMTQKTNLKSQTETAKNSNDRVITSPYGELVRKIRQDIVNDKTVAVSAQNVSISTRDNRIIVEGTVKSAKDKKRIQEIARHAAGDVPIVDQTIIK